MRTSDALPAASRNIEDVVCSLEISRIALLRGDGFIDRVFSAGTRIWRNLKGRHGSLDTPVDGFQPWNDSDELADRLART